MKNVFSAAVAALAGAASIVAGPAGVAAAEPELNGTYTFTWDTSQSPKARDGGVSNFQWVITPCGSGCASVSSDGISQGEMHLVNGRWEMTKEVTLPGLGPCYKPERPSSNTIFTSLDAETLTGFRSNTQNCLDMTIEGPASLVPA